MRTKQPSLSERFLAAWREFGGGIQDPVTEHQFHPERRWRFDYAFPELKVAIEIEGGTFMRGRHTRGAAYSKDCEKYNAATVLGWKVIRFDDHLLKEPQDAIDMVLQVMGVFNPVIDEDDEAVACFC